MFLLYNEQFKIIGISSEKRENSIEFVGLEKIPFGSTYDKENNLIVTPENDIIDLNNNNNLILEEI